MKKRIANPFYGQTLVEFALILPVFIFLAVVIFDFGRAVYYYNAVHNAAREGARYGVIYPNDTAGMKAAASKYAIGLGLTPSNITAWWGDAGYIGSNQTYNVTVNVTFCFKPITPLVEIFVKNSGCTLCTCSELLLSSDAVMRTETKP